MVRDQNRTRSCPYGPMDKAPAYGAGDSGFESQYGLNLFLFRSLQTVFCVRVREGWLIFPQEDPSPSIPAQMHVGRACGFPERKKGSSKLQKGVMRESNSRPPAPEAGIIPLDQSPWSLHGLDRPRDFTPKGKETCWS
jgi:hypothetical protein